MMRRPELDHVLNSMLESQPEVSDLLFTVNRPFQVEAYGELKPVTLDPPIERLTPYQTEAVALNIIGENQWDLQYLMKKGSCDTTRRVLHCLPQTQHGHPDSRDVEVSRDSTANSAGKNRLGPRHRRNWLRQIHHPRGGA